jgi:hypothetical protein
VARGQSGAPVSFFAFQDIITAVSGILIIVVLLLTLELVEQREVEAAPAGRPADVSAELAAAEAERDSLKAELADEAAAVKAAAGASAGELRSQSAALRTEIERLGGEVAKAEARKAELTAAEKAVEVRRFDAAETLARAEQAGRKADELRRQIEEAKRDDRPVFSLPRGFNKAGWLAVLGGSSVEAAPIGRTTRPTRIAGPDGATGSADAFLRWADEHDGDYFLLLVRPSGAEIFKPVDDAFREKGVSYGFDAVGEGQIVLHPERGAAP